jgi:hypothetical protein
LGEVAVEGGGKRDEDIKRVREREKQTVYDIAVAWIGVAER